MAWLTRGPHAHLLAWGAVASVIAALVVTFAGIGFDWPLDSVLRVAALCVSGVWLVVGVAHVYVADALVSALREHHWRELGAPLAQPLIEAPDAARIVLVNKAPASDSIELPSGASLMRADLTAFVDGLDTRGHERKGWLGYKFPSGRPFSNAYHQTLIEAIRTTGEFEKWGQGIKAVRRLTTDEIKDKLQL